MNNNTYAGNLPDNKDNQRIYKITFNEKPYFNIHNKNILYTELKPTQEQIIKLTNPNNTIIYTPDQDTAIIRHKQTRFTSTPTKVLYSLIYNQPLTVTFQYYNYNDNYPASIANIQKQLSTHNITVKLIDLKLNYTLTLPPCATGTEDYIPDLNWEQYTDTLRPYLRALRKDQELQQQLSYNKPKQLNPTILSYVTTWAPAYDIDLPTPPTDSLYNYQQEYFYNSQIMIIYHQLKYYEQVDLPINDDYTICPHCNKPFHINQDFCTHCDTPIDDDIYLQLD